MTSSILQMPTVRSTHRLVFVICFLSDGHSNWNQMTCYLGFTFISLIAKDVECFFLFVIHIFLENFIIISSAHFLNFYVFSTLIYC